MPKKQTSFKEAAGGRLDRIREYLALDDGEFADLLGISPQSWTAWKKGDACPQPEKLVRLKTAKHVTLDYIYSGDSSGLPHKMALDLAQPASVAAEEKPGKRRVA